MTNPNPRTAMDVNTSVTLRARNVMLQDKHWEALRDLAHVERTSISEIVRDAITRELKRRARA